MDYSLASLTCAVEAYAGASARRDLTAMVAHPLRALPACACAPAMDVVAKPSGLC